jgi:hypothetical protein
MLPKLHRRHEVDSHYPVFKMSPGIRRGFLFPEYPADVWLLAQPAVARRYRAIH